MTTEELKVLERRFFDEMLNRGDLSAGDDLFAEDSVDYAGFPGQAPGREGFKQAVVMMHAAFPDIHYTIEDMVAEGENLVRAGIDMQNKAKELRILAEDNRNQANLADSSGDAQRSTQLRLEAQRQEAEAPG